jgi:dihydroorotase
VIRASTLAPAKAVGLDDRIGHLAVGRDADITVLRMEEGRFPLFDIHLAVRIGRQRLVPVAVWKRGAYHECQAAPVAEVPST